MPSTEHATRLTDADEAEILRRAESDPDSPPATDEQLAKPMSFEEALPGHAAALKRRGRPFVENPKEHVSLRPEPGGAGALPRNRPRLAGAHRCGFAEGSRH